jgi:hypothetical protein
MWAAPCAGGFIKKDSVGLGRSRTRDLQNQSSRAGVRFARSASASAHTFWACEPVVGARAATAGEQASGGRFCASLSPNLGRFVFPLVPW